LTGASGSAYRPGVPTARARLTAIRRRLLAWWDAGHRELPWRFPQHGADPYRVWLAEVMLQQTQVATVVPYYRRFVARLPTLEALASAREDEVLALWSGLGYYARGRNLLAAARAALSRHGGLPASVAELRALPGFGPYTAGAVASIAFAVPAPAVDGNVTRVLARLEGLTGDPGGRRFRARVEVFAAALVGAERPGDQNQALMELGATVCARRAPACRRCPLAPLCAARAAGRAEEIPAPRRRPARRSLALACAVVRRRGALLLVRRPAAGLFGGLWAPPSAEVAPREDSRARLARALGAVPGGRWEVGEEVAACERLLTHRRLALRAFRCEPQGKLQGGGALCWVPPARLDGLGVPAAFRALLARA
jgi:A/G-specific adenine glycosylase